MRFMVVLSLAIQGLIWRFPRLNVKLSPTKIRCRALAPNLASAPHLTAHQKRALGGNDPSIN